MKILIKYTLGLGSVGVASLLAAGPAVAQEAAAAAAKIDSGDTAWLLTSTAIVLMMTIPGVALFYGGMVRKKNVLSVLAQSFTITCLISIIWMVIGYSLAFTKGATPYFGGFSGMFFAGLTKGAVNGTIPDSLFIVFQMTFAIITAALITGAFAERMKFSSMLVFISVWSIVVYSPVAYWVWGGGFLGDKGVLDFAGGTVVHINSGVAALVAAVMIGKRKGYGTENLAPHNLVLSVIGAAMLWVGWFGFNAGSAVAADGSAAMAMLVTQIASAAAALSWLFFEWATHKRPTVLGVISGAIAGLVAVTPASGFVGPVGALIIGLISGVVCFWGAAWLKPKLGYDDSLDVFAVHGLGGIVGALLTGILAEKAIGGTAGSIGQLWIQFQGIIWTILWSAIATAVILFIVDKIMGLRVDEDTEAEGLDLRI
ncbi:MAG: ammonium transporter, partial [Proteobacteria bacterium]|nr:ammonium transporter [Pseudomonadota bacterium]